MNKKNVEYLCHFLDYFLNISKVFFVFFFVKRKSGFEVHIKKKGNEDTFYPQTTDTDA